MQVFGRIVTQTELGILLGVNSATIAEWRAAGCPSEKPKDKRSVLFNTCEVIRWLLERERKKSPRKEADAARDQKAIIDAKRAQLAYDIEAGNVDSEIGETSHLPPSISDRSEHHEFSSHS